MLDKFFGPKERSQRLLDGDDLLEHLLSAWVTRARHLYAALSAAADAEEREADRVLKFHIENDSLPVGPKPLTESESRFFHKMIQRYWHAPIAWEMEYPRHRKHFLQERTAEEIAALYTNFRQTYEASHSVPWKWQEWEWDNDWDWSGIPLVQNEAESLTRAPHARKRSITVNLAHFAMGDRTVQRLGQLFHTDLTQPTLHNLILRGNDVRGKGCGIVINGVQERRIRLCLLDISDNDIGEQGSRAIATLVRDDDCVLEILNLENNKLRDAKTRHLLDAIGVNKSLKSVNLAKNLFARGDQLSVMIQKNTTIVTLDLSWNTLRSKAAILIALAFVDNSTIEEFYIQFNSFSNAGMLAMGKALQQNQSLRHLDIGFNSINGAECKQIAAKLAKSALKHLVLDGNPIGFDGATVFQTECSAIQVSIKECATLTLSREAL